MTEDSPCIWASFTDYKPIKTRGVLQVICEVPIEQQADVFQALGYPMPHEDRWVAIALLRDPGKLPESRRPEEILIPPEDHRATSPPPPAGAYAKNPARSMAAKEHYASQDEAEKLITKAAILCRDQQFQDWLGKDGESAAKEAVHDICRVESCKTFRKSRMACDRFERLVTEFEIETGRRAEPR